MVRKAIMRRLAGAGDERGSAVVTVVLVTTVTVMLTTVVLQMAAVTLNNSGSRNQWEQSFHLGEAGTARALSMLAANAAYSTGDTLSASPTKTEILAAAADNPLEAGPEGEYSWVRVPGQEIAYGVGYVPSRAAAQQSRVVRVHYRLVAGGGDRAVLTRSPLSMSGNVSIKGVGGGVHSNTDLTVSGHVAIEQDATATGAFATHGTPTIGGQSGGGFPALSIPQVDPPSLRSRATYTLCPDGLVRLTTNGPACTGALVGAGVGPGWNGWTFRPAGWAADCNKAQGTAADNVVFYAHHTNVDVTCQGGALWRTTIIVDGAGSAGSLLNGDLFLSGGGAIQPVSQGMLFVADRDLRISGSVTMTGLSMAGEQMQITGSGTQAFGQLVAAGAANSIGSPVAANDMAGTFTLNAVFGTPGIQGGIETVRWAEVAG